MSSNNSIPPFLGASLKEVQETLGITQFPTDNTWNQIIGGLILQGGLEPALGEDTSRTITFSIPFPKKLLGVFVQSIVAGENLGNTLSVNASPGLTSFAVGNDGPPTGFFWFAIGI